jgi:hypothetical protein
VLLAGRSEAVASASDWLSDLREHGPIDLCTGLRQPSWWILHLGLMLHLRPTSRLSGPAAVRTSTTCCSAAARSSSSSSSTTKRAWHASTGAAAAAALAAVVLQLAPLPVSAALAEEGGPAPDTIAAAATLSSSSSTEAIKQAIQKDFVTGQYYVTGQLTPALYEPDCLFIDPTTRVKGEQQRHPPLHTSTMHHPLRLKSAQTCLLPACSSMLCSHLPQQHWTNQPHLVCTSMWRQARRGMQHNTTHNSVSAPSALSRPSSGAVSTTHQALACRRHT